jgi:hypothetical protein
MASVVINGDTSGAVTISAPAVAGTTTLTLPTTSGTVLTTATSTGISGSAISSGTVPEAYGGTGTSTGYNGFKNRIINGAMVIDQRNAGATLTLSGSSQFAVDRFVASKDTAGATCTAQRSTTSTIGFSNSFLWTTTTGATSGASDESIIWQNIEGFNVADLAWGTASAATVTLSFWVRSSLTGTFGVAFRSPSGSRNYVSSYTINSANTFEYKTITVAGDTTGTWATDNSTGLRVNWDMGCGTSKSTTAGSWGAGNLPGLTGGVKVSQNTGATWYITGVQLEKGSTATSFDYRPYGTELQLCQRYYYRIVPGITEGEFGAICGNQNTTVADGIFMFPVIMRTPPTALEQTGTAANYAVYPLSGGSRINCSSVPVFGAAFVNCAKTRFTVASGLTAGQVGLFLTGSAAPSTTYLGWSAEL